MLWSSGQSLMSKLMFLISETFDPRRWWRSELRDTMAWRGTAVKSSTEARGCWSFWRTFAGLASAEATRQHQAAASLALDDGTPAAPKVPSPVPCEGQEDTRWWQQEDLCLCVASVLLLTTSTFFFSFFFTLLETLVSDGPEEPEVWNRMAAPRGRLWRREGHRWAERTSKPTRWCFLVCLMPHVTRSKASFHSGASLFLHSGTTLLLNVLTPVSCLPC